MALGDLHVDGEPFGLCPRSTLKRAVKDWEALGLSPMVGLETEAYIFQRDQDGIWRPHETPGAFVYGTGPENDPRGVMEQDPWVETIEERMNSMAEASIMDALTACFSGIDAQAISTQMTRRMSKSLQLAGWVKDGKFNTGSRRNQVKFVNPTQTERKPEADFGF